MTAVVSAIGEATGLKPDDKVIGLNLAIAAKGKAMAYFSAALSSTSPDIRHVFLTHMQESMTEHEHLSGLAISKGWVDPNVPADELVKTAIEGARPLLQ